MNLTFREFILLAETDALLEGNRILWIDPKTNKNWRALSKWRHLEEIYNDQITKGVDPNKLWVTFSEVAKLGQRTKIKLQKSTPVGIFAFPVSYVLDKKDLTPFADRKYMHLFKTTKPHMEVGNNTYDVLDLSGFEHEDKLKEFAEKNGLNYQYALNDAKSGASHKEYKRVYNTSQLVYRIAEALAKQWVTKVGGDFRMKWNLILRYIGVSSAADTKDSGHIHSSEYTQGVFMDPQDITLIATINMESHSDQISPLGKGELSGVSNQRKGPGGDENFENSVKLRVIKLINKVSNSSHYVSSLREIDYSIAQLIKLAKTAKTKAINLPANRVDFSKLETTYSQYPKILEKIKILKELLAGKHPKVPIYGKSKI